MKPTLLLIAMLFTSVVNAHCETDFIQAEM